MELDLTVYMKAPAVLVTDMVKELPEQIRWSHSGVVRSKRGVRGRGGGGGRVDVPVVVLAKEKTWSLTVSCSHHGKRQHHT